MTRTSRLLSTAAVLAVAGTLVAAPSQAAPDGYYSVPFSDDLYYHEHHADGTSTTGKALFQEWAADGFPISAPAPVSYEKVAWWADVFARLPLDPGDQQVVALDYEEWSRAGRPNVSTVPWVDFSLVVVRYASSDEVFVSQIADDYFGPGYHRLTFAEWRDAGFPAVERSETSGFYSYPWSNHVGGLWDTTTGSGDRLEQWQWAYYGHPTPQIVTHVIGEVVWKRSGSPTLYLDSPITGDGFQLTYDQWTALGRPAPVVR